MDRIKEIEIVVRECQICGKFMSKEDYEKFDRVCEKHWDE